MAKHKTDGSIGRRMYSEVVRLFGGIAPATRVLNCQYHTVEFWYRGQCPSSYYLAKLVEFGGDAMYVLTGRRGEDGCTES